MKKLFYVLVVILIVLPLSYYAFLKTGYVWFCILITILVLMGFSFAFILSIKIISACFNKSFTRKNILVFGFIILNILIYVYFISRSLDIVLTQYFPE